MSKTSLKGHLFLRVALFYVNIVKIGWAEFRRDVVKKIKVEKKRQKFDILFVNQLDPNKMIASDFDKDVFLSTLSTVPSLVAVF